MKRRKRGRCENEKQKMQVKKSRTGRVKKKAVQEMKTQRQKCRDRSRWRCGGNGDSRFDSDNKCQRVRERRKQSDEKKLIRQKRVRFWIVTAAEIWGESFSYENGLGQSVLLCIPPRVKNCELLFFSQAFPMASVLLNQKIMLFQL